MLNRKYQCNGFMTNWAKWGCGKGRGGLSQTESDRSDRVGQVGRRR